MFTKQSSRKLWFGVILFVGLVILAACSPSEPAIETPLPDPEFETAVPVVAETEEPLPSPMAEPAVLLVTGRDADAIMVNQVQQRVDSLAADSGMRLVLQEGLTPEMITAEVQVVIGIGQDLGFNGIAAGAPGVSFAVMGDPEATVTENLSKIGDPLMQARQKAFMAGYVSALTSRDNKVAALISEVNPASAMLVESFVAGARYFCGLCQPIFPPYSTFPQWVTLASASQEADFRTSVDNFFNIGVEVLYVDGELSSPELLAYLDELGIKVVGDQSPDLQRSNWVGTIMTDPLPALEGLWPDLVAGAAGSQASAQIVIKDMELGLLSTARYRLFELMVADILEGNVSVEITP
jgi:hypothetical protein